MEKTKRFGHTMVSNLCNSLSKKRKGLAKKTLAVIVGSLVLSASVGGLVYNDQQDNSNMQSYDTQILPGFEQASDMFKKGNCAIISSYPCTDCNKAKELFEKLQKFNENNKNNLYDKIMGFDDSKIDAIQNKSQEKIDTINCNRIVTEFKEQGEEIECFDKGNIQGVLNDGRYLYTGKDGVLYTYDTGLPENKRVKKVDLNDDNLLAIDANDKRSIVSRLNGERYFNPGGSIWDCSNQKCEEFIGNKAFRRGGAQTIYAVDRAQFSAVNQDNSLMAFVYYKPQGIIDPIFYSNYLAVQDLNEKNKYDNIKNQFVASLKSTQSNQERLQVLSEYYGKYESSVMLHVIRNIPIYDSSKQEFVTFDSALRSRFNSGDFGSDPASTVYEMFFGEKKGFISPFSGNWVNYESALNEGYATNTKPDTFKKIILPGYGNRPSYPGVDGMCWMGDRTLFIHGSLSKKDGENVYRLTFDKNDLRKTPSLSKVYKEKERVLHRGNYDIYCINNKKEIIFNNEYGELVIIDVNGNIKKSFDNVKIYKTLKNNNINKKYSFIDLNTKLTFVSK